MKTFSFKKHGFTLIETLIYIGILVFSLGLITNFALVLLKTNQKIQIEHELNNQMIRLEEIFRQKVNQAKKINEITSNSLKLEMAEPSLNPTIFSWENDALYLTEGISKVVLNDKSKIKVTNLIFSYVIPIEAGRVFEENYHYAWNDQVGWLDFADPSVNIFIPIGEGELSGMFKILSDNSWVYFNCLNLNICNQSNFKVEKLSNGDLSGWAWSENYGWISFNCQTDNSCGASSYKVYIDEDGFFHGFAWSENIGWISFNCENGGENNGNICNVSDYKVKINQITSPIIKVYLTLTYNSSKPELSIPKTKTFIVQLLKPE